MKNKKKWFADRTAIGHYKPYVTHVLSECDAANAFTALDPCANEFQGRIADAGSAEYSLAMRATATAWNKDRAAPSWRITFPSSVLYHAAGPADGPVLNVLTHKSLIAGT